jgi:CRP/FNR family cyclic AMP-dependent transcriptional regulator
MAIDDIVRLLENVPIFEAMSPEDLRRVAEVAIPRRFAAGQIIFREGDASDTCYVVRAGHARAIRENVDGRAIALAHFGPGEFFGELAMLDPERRSATLEALDALEAIAIAGSDMRRLMHQHAAIASKLAIALARRLREANQRLSRQSFQTVQSRVAGVLIQLVEQAQSEGAGARDVELKVTQAKIAELAGSSRESASRFLAVLERATIITQGRGRIVVHDPEALKRYIF